MRIRRSCWSLLVAPLVATLAGCSYVHFGSPERFRTDARLVAENSDLRIEKKLLQQELAIARKEGETLRAALDRPPADSPDLVARLNDTTRELAELRASYARLQAQRDRLPSAASSAGTEADLQARLGATEEQLAQALRTYTALQEENSRLRTSIDQVRAENATLTARVEHVSAANNEARSALAQLNTELLAQKEARAQAEQRAEALRAQLVAMANAAPTPASPSTSLAAARETSAAGARAIEGALRTPVLSADSSAGAMLSIDTSRLRQTQAEPAAAEPPPAPAKPARIYVVEAGDTLEKISQKVYGRPDRWHVLYSTNNALLSGDRPLEPGMELQVPE